MKIAFCVKKNSLCTEWGSSLINTSNINNPVGQARTGLYISPDGTLLFTTSTYNDYTYTYSLGTPFDISTMSYVRAWSSSIGENNGCWFTDDGLHMLLSRSSSGSESIRHYTLGTAFNTTTLSTANVFSLLDYTYKGCMAQFWNSGTIMTQGALKYSLSSAYDVSTATQIGDMSWLMSLGSVLNEIQIRPDGKTIYQADSINHVIRKYKLNTYLGFDEADGGTDLGIIVSSLPGNRQSTVWSYQDGKVFAGDDYYNTQQPIYEYEYHCNQYA